METEDPADLYEGVWGTLCELVSVLRKRGVSVPSEIVAELRSAKSLISGYRVNPEAVEILSQVQTYLKTAERRLIGIAREEGYQETAIEYLGRLDEVRRGAGKRPRAVGQAWFIPGLPRGGRWIRIKISPQTPLSRLEEVATKSRISLKPQEGGFVLASGRREDLKEFIRVLRSKTQALI